MKTGTLLISAAVGLVLCGCVERLITVSSEPSGAIVWLNGEEAGATPMTKPFTWYGAYEVVLRKGGYETLRTTRQIDPPIYQWFGLDFVCECLLPFEFVDRHEWHFELSAHKAADPDALIERARELRREALPANQKLP